MGRSRAIRRIQKGLHLARRNPGLAFEKLWSLRPRRVPAETADGRVGDLRFRYEFDLDLRVSEMWHGRYELPIQRLLRKYLPQGGTMIDVGANIGYISAVGAHCVGTSGRVVALEPVGRYWDRLVRIASDNPNYHIDALRVAAGDRAGTAMMRVSDVGNCGYNSMTPGWVPEDELGAVEEVRVVTLDGVVMELGLGRVDLIKIDTEGFEIPALWGAEATLSRFRPVLVVEVTSSAARNHNTSLESLSDWLRGAGYTAHPVEAPGYNLDIARIEGRADVLLLPALHRKA